MFFIAYCLSIGKVYHFPLFSNVSNVIWQISEELQVYMTATMLCFLYRSSRIFLHDCIQLCDGWMSPTASACRVVGIIGVSAHLTKGKLGRGTLVTLVAEVLARNDLLEVAPLAFNRRAVAQPYQCCSCSQNMTHPFANLIAYF